MRCTMQFIHDRKISNSLHGTRPYVGLIEQVPIHPDDFAAHLAWVRAKRFLMQKSQYTKPDHQ